ncbi:MAG: hypothetical protein V2I47_06605, partial [Bacteroidales bacterium]|nr:hypothetical protein [Bacteroidales bacterium]
MRHILLIQLILALSLQTIYADNITVSGSVSGTWECDTVFVSDDIDIEVGDSLIIRPGVYVAFASTHSLYVRGYIRAEGTADNRITFDVMDTTDFSNDTLAKGGWNGIHFYYNGYTPDSSIFDFCAFYHGKAVSLDSIEEHGGAMCLRDIDRLRISNCIFENNFARYNGGAIHMEESDVLIKDNLFVANRCGPTEEPWGYGGAICCDHSDARITGNYFYDNTSTGVGGAVAVRFMESMINNNIFAGNHSALGGAIGFLHYYEYPYTHCNNLMHGNSATFFGGAIANLDCGPTHVNYTLTGNISVYGGAFYVKDSLVPNVYNTIMYDNYAQEGPEVYLWDAYASANFYYCDIKGGIEAFSGSGGVGFMG